MTDEEIMKLAAAITVAMGAAQPAPAPEPEPEPEPEPAQEPGITMEGLQAAMAEMVEKMGDQLKTSLQASNITGSRQPEPATAEQILAKIINPPNKAE